MIRMKNLLEVADENLPEVDDVLSDPVSDEKKPFKSKLSDEEIEKLVVDNMKLAYYLANKYQNIVRAEKSDIEQQALGGLVKAANMWDPSKGAFPHYASRAIRNWLGHMFHVEKDTKAHEFGAADVGSSSGGDDDEADSRPQEIERYQKHDAYSADYENSKKEATALVSKLIKELPDLERRVLTQYLSGKSYRDMQPEFGVSFVMIGHIAKRAIKMIKDRLADYGVNELPDILPESIEELSGILIHEVWINELTQALLFKSVNT